MIPPLFAILSWPVVGWLIRRRATLQQAIVWVILGGYLFLPEKGGINLPVLPTVSKQTMPSLVAVALVLFALRRRANGPPAPVTPDQVILPGWLPKYRLATVLLIALLAGEVVTVLTNGDRLVYGPTVLQGLTLYDAGSRVTIMVMALLPLLVARKCLATPEQHKTLVLIFVIGGLIYSLPTLWEARMSPQLNLHVYGTRVADWRQHVRNDGYRPVVFLNHGLWLAAFMATSVIASAAYIRLARPRGRLKLILATIWLLGTLLLMNSLGGFLIALILLGPVLFMTGRLQILVAACLVGVVLLYPMLRGAGLIPTDRVLSSVSQISVDRAQSLDFRLRNEDLLLDQARQRPLFGWGSWGRNNVYDDKGRDITITDGTWIIEIGSNGWVGYLTRFGLLCVPIIVLALRRRRYPTEPATVAVAMMLTANLLDLIPNATLTPLTWLLAGALLGRLEYSPAQAGAPHHDALSPAIGRSGHTAYGRRGPAAPPVAAHAGSPGADIAAAEPRRAGPGYSRQRPVHIRQKKDQSNA